MAENNAPISNNLTDADVQFLGKLYLEKRYQSQIKFYDSRIRENNYNSNVTFYLSSGLMIFSGLISTFNLIIGPTDALSVLAAILPALAALFGAFNQIYDWDRQSSLYYDASAQLLRLQNHPIASYENLTDFIARAETVFRSEGDQWGQTITEQKKQ